MADEHLMTIEEFGKRIKVSRASAYEIFSAGHVDWVNVSTSKRPKPRITEAALERYITSRLVKGRRSET